MERIPREVLDLIVSHLLPTPHQEQNQEQKLSTYATISRAWQHAIEQHTFAKLSVSSSDVDGQFSSVFADARRRPLLRQVTFTVVLPAYPKKRSKKIQGRREGAANNAAYTRALVGLFSRLHSWSLSGGGDDTHGPNPALALTLRTWCSRDGEDRDDHRWSHDQWPPTWQIRNTFSYISIDLELLLSLGGLAPLPFVTSLNIDATGYRNVDLAVVVHLAGALSSLQAIMGWFYAPQRRMRALYRRVRSSFADGLLAIAGIQTLREVDLYWEDSGVHHSFPLPSLLEDDGTDKLSVAVGRLLALPLLRSLSLRGQFVLSPEVFLATPPLFPSTSDRGPSNRPSLEKLNMEISATTPGGGWYFTGDPATAEPYDDDYDDDDGDLVWDDNVEYTLDFDSADSDSTDVVPTEAWERADNRLQPFRNRPNDATLTPLLTGLARLIDNMHSSLKSAQLDIAGNPGCGMYVQYFAPEPPGSSLSKGFTTDEAAFHRGNIDKGRWVLFCFDEEFDEGWTLPSEPLAALQDAGGGEGCVALNKNPGIEVL